MIKVGAQINIQTEVRDLNIHVILGDVFQVVQQNTISQLLKEVPRTVNIQAGQEELLGQVKLGAVIIIED